MEKSDNNNQDFTIEFNVVGNQVQDVVRKQVVSGQRSPESEWMHVQVGSIDSGSSEQRSKYDVTFIKPHIPHPQ